MSARILVTRPAEGSAALGDLLQRRGFRTVAVPTIAIDAASTARELDSMLATLEGADWLVVTSANGATAIADRLAARGRRLPAATQVAAVGPGTAAALEEAGITVAHVPDRYLGVAVAEGLGEVRGLRIALARADIAGRELPDLLRARGAVVEETVAYRVLEGPPASRDALRVSLQPGLDGIAFTSASTVRGLLRIASPLDRDRLSAVRSFCIGPPTAETARASGFDVAAVAEPHTARGLADAISTYFARETS